MQNEINGEFYRRLRRPKTVTVNKRIINNIKKQKRKSKRKHFKKEIIEGMIIDYRVTTTENAITAENDAKKIRTYEGGFITLLPSLMLLLLIASSMDSSSSSFLNFWIAESTAFLYESAAIPLGINFPLQCNHHTKKKLSTSKSKNREIKTNNEQNVVV